MMTRDADKKREQMMMFSMDDMVPKDHMLRKIEHAIDWRFIYNLVEDKYCTDNGRPSMDRILCQQQAAALPEKTDLPMKSQKE